MNRPEGYCPQAVRERHALRKADRCEWERPSRLYVQPTRNLRTGITNAVPYAIGTWVCVAALVLIFWS